MTDPDPSAPHGTERVAPREHRAKMLDTFSLPKILNVVRVKADACRRVGERAAKDDRHTHGNDWLGLACELDDVASMLNLHIDASRAVPDAVEARPTCGSCGQLIVHDSVAKEISYWRCRCGNPHWFRVAASSSASVVPPSQE